ncbi:MAG: acetolactate synthase large subunit [Gammaproteobacteria bacterium]|nr:acetolactate synthase large subunit [Gammaproteobacteria bacterium]
MKASDLFIRCLEAEGVEYIFGVPGEENADIMISLLDSTIRFIVCRHEQGAAFMADAYGRLTGKPAVCLGTLGPGATNLLTGVGDADMDRAPLIVVTGQASTTRLHKESHQVTDLVSIFRPCVKWGVQITHPDSIPEIIRKAFRISTTDKFGACHIDLPENIAHMETLARPLRPEPVLAGAPDPESITRASNIIKAAKFPILLTGNGVFRGDAADDLRSFAQATGIPAVNTFMGKGGIPLSSPLCLFTVGLGARDYPAVAIERADCVITIGFDMVEYHPTSWNRGNQKQIIHIDMSPAEIDSDYQTDVELVGNISTSLSDLQKALGGMNRPSAESYKDLRDTMLGEFSEHASDTAMPMKPQRILSDTKKILNNSDIVLSDVGAHKMWIARNFQAEQPNTVLISNGWCSMGFALPGAIGAKLARPEQNIVAICGDGGVMMNIQELETAVRENLKIIVMVWSDSEYGLIKWKQQAQFGKYSHIAFNNPDWMKLAEAFGMDGYRVEQADDLTTALQSAIQSHRSVLIEVPVDYSENMKLTGRLSEIPFDDLCGCLQHVDLFKQLPEQYRRTIAEMMGSETFEAGATIFSEGDPGDTVYIVHSGRVSIRKGDQVVSEVTDGGEFGEMAAVSSAPRAATVVAEQDTVCGTLSGEAFRELLRAEPDLAIHLTRLFASRFASAKRR